jgi:polar amino acid transport system substrate-binding protein
VTQKIFSKEKLAPLSGRGLRILTIAALIAAGAASFFPLRAQNAEGTQPEKKEEATLPVPRFRQVDPAGKPLSFTRDQTLILADDDFPPFSYAGPDGDARGIAVDAAVAACQELHTKCQVVLMPWQSLSGAPTDGSIIAGLRVDEATLARFQPTRPIYRALGRFAVRKESDLTHMTRDTIAGKRVGVVAGSGYEGWLKRNFSDAVIVPYPNLADLQEALRTAKVEIMFGDGLQLVYWMKGSASQSCCKFVDGAYYDDTLFSRPYVFMVQRNDMELKQAFDYAFDQLQEQGIFAKIFGRYIPAPFW